MTADPIVIVGARRTPMGGFQGELSGLTASQLGASAIRAALAQSGVPGDAVTRGVMGCVLGAGQVRPRRGRRCSARGCRNHAPR